MPMRNGETFAGFRIVRLLGSGGMGEVYLAGHPRLPRCDALKVLPADVCSDPDYRASFEREADLASKLWHPHIPQHSGTDTIFQINQESSCVTALLPHLRLLLLVKSLSRLGCTRFGSPGIFG